MKKLLLILFAFAGLLNELSATTFMVTNTNNSGTGSLRQAIASAITDGTATSGNPHLILASSVTGTISLTYALPDLSNHIIITGPSNGGLIISGASGFRVFNMSGSSYTISLNYLTIQNGDPGSSFGGGIWNGGTLYINYCTIQNNTVTGTAQGGGIFNSSDGILYINSSTLSNNSCQGNGGGLVNYGTAALNNCTVYANTAAYGGGIMNYKILGIQNTSIVNNISEGIYYSTNTINSLAIENSIIVGSSTKDLDINVATGVTCSYSAIGTLGSNATLNGSGNIISTFAAIYGTATLANNGGATKTIALFDGSPAVNAGLGSDAPSADQRDVSRVGDADMGSYEYDGPVTGVLNRHSSQEYVKVSSNPGNGIYNAEVNSSVSGDFEWKVTDNNGRTVNKGGNFSKGNSDYSFSVNISDQASGAYFLIITSEKGLLSQTLIKQ